MGNCESMISTSYYPSVPDIEKARYIAASCPATVLELIAEDERKANRIAELEAEVEKLRSDPLYSTRQDADRFRRAIALEDSAESLYAAVLNHAPDTIAIRREFDAAIAAHKKAGRK